MGFQIVYILESIAAETRFYVGRTTRLQARLQKHNCGAVAHTAKYRPWRIKNAMAFRDLQKAINFERYLKSASGRAFARKHL